MMKISFSFRKRQTNFRYLCVADYTNIYIFKYNSSKDLFSLTQVRLIAYSEKRSKFNVSRP